MLSSTVSPRNSWLVSNVRAMPRCARAACERWVMSSPSSSTCPADGLSAPVMRLTSVVLPAPFGPISARRAPRSRVSSMSRATRSAPKLLLRPRISRTGVVMRVLVAGRADYSLTRPQKPPQGGQIIEADQAIAVDHLERREDDGRDDRRPDHLGPQPRQRRRAGIAARHHLARLDLRADAPGQHREQHHPPDDEKD